MNRTATPQQEDVLKRLRDFDHELESLWDSGRFVGAALAAALAVGYVFGRLHR